MLGAMRGLRIAVPVTFVVLVGGLVFGASTVLAAGAPSVVSESVPSVTPFEARLEATVNAGEEAPGLTTECHFQYGTTVVTENEKECEQGNALEGGEQGVSLNVTVPAPGTPLTPNKLYHYRVVLKNATGEVQGTGKPAEEEFTTLTLKKPEVEGESAVEVPGGITFALEAQVNPNYQETTYHFEYAAEPAVLLAGHGATVPGGSLPAEFGAQSVTVTLSQGLMPGTTYYYRVVATNGTGTETGTPEQFTTPLPPGVVSGEAVEVTYHTASVSGVVNPEGVETYYRVQYGTTTAYGQNSTPVDAGGEVNEIATGAIRLTSLDASTTYHYRVVATNGNGEVSFGEDRQFTTMAAPPVPVEEAQAPAPAPAPLTAAAVGSTFPNLTGIAPIPAPKETTSTGSKPKSLTRAQKLSKALKACKRDKGAKQRASCEKQARARYGASTKNKKKAR